LRIANAPKATPNNTDKTPKTAKPNTVTPVKRFGVQSGLSFNPSFKEWTRTSYKEYTIQIVVSVINVYMLKLS